MDPFHGACEIVELRDELVASQHSKETNRLSGRPIVDDRTEKFSRQKTAGRYTLEDEINKLFEAIELRASARGLGPSCQFSKGSSQISASKKPIRGGISQASGIGISESVTLKQALRGLRISHASEVAAMKRVSKSTASSKVAEAVAVKRLYRAVVVEANDSGLTLDESKGSLLQISLVPEESKLNSSEKISSQATREENLNSTVHSSPQFAVPATTEISMIKAQPEEGIGPVPTEVGTQALTLKLGQEGKLKSALSLCCSNISNRTETLSKDTTASKDIESKRAMMKFGKNLKLNFSSSLLNSSASSKVKKSVSNSPRVVNPVPKNNCFPNKKMKREVSSACSSSNTCIADVDSALSPSASKVVCQAQNSNQNVLKEPACPAFSSTCLDVNVSLSNADYKANKSVQGLDSCNKRNFDAKASECSRSREAADFSQSSKSSLGAYSSTTCISDESNVCGSSCSGSRPHMSKDLRWEAIRRVEMQHGSLDLRHFKLLKRLGCGDLGTVYLAELTGTNCLFAMKIMDNESLGSRKKMPRALTERDILQVLDHPFLPTLFAYFTTNKFSILVMEYCPGGDLHILRQKQPGSIFTEQAARFYVAEVLLALEYLHMLGIVYRDLKPENILVREDGHIMLSDFDLSLRCTVKPTLVKASLSLPTPTKGISGPCVGCICTDPFCVQPSWVQVPCFTPRHASTPTNIRKLKSNSMTQVPQLLAEPTNARSHSFVGTHEYLAPEIIRGEGHGNAVDWWTFGIFLYELLFGTTPFKGPGNDDTLVNVVMHSVKFPESSSVSSQAKDLIRGLLRKEPKDRFGSAKGAAEIRKHPFFKGLNWALIRCAVPPTVPKSSETGVSLTTTEENKLVEYKMSSAEHPEFDTF